MERGNEILSSPCGERFAQEEEGQEVERIGMAPIIHMDSQVHQPWTAMDARQARGGGGYASQQQWAAGGQMHMGGPMVLARDILDDGVFAAPAPAGMTPGRPLPRTLPAPMMGRDLNDAAFMGRGYSIKRCQGFVRCDMDIDAEVVGWVIGKNGENIVKGFSAECCNTWFQLEEVGRKCSNNAPILLLESLVTVTSRRVLLCFVFDDRDV